MISVFRERDFSFFWNLRNGMPPGGDGGDEDFTPAVVIFTPLSLGVDNELGVGNGREPGLVSEDVRCSADSRRTLESPLIVEFPREIPKALVGGCRKLLPLLDADMCDMEERPLEIPFLVPSTGWVCLCHLFPSGEFRFWRRPKFLECEFVECVDKFDLGLPKAQS